jgi:ribonuclease PH
MSSNINNHDETIFNRLNNRLYSELRNILITRNYTNYAEGSVLIEFGDTKVICTATVDDNLPPFLKNKNVGWLTAEYAMLPRATHTRNKRDTIGNKPNSRGQEISRLIGRSLRSCIDLTKIPGKQIIIDCDVIQADGGTRTASITGGFIALYDAIQTLILAGAITENPIKHFIAAVSVGMVRGNLLLDLDYNEDSNCDMDMNLVMQESLSDLSIVEIQGAAEGAAGAMNKDTLNKLLDLAEVGIARLIQLQKHALEV